MTFKAIGYVEKADGKLEAIILQENQVLVVHIGDRIMDRYRITRITPDLVDAIDETLGHSPMTPSGGAKSEVLAVKPVEPPSTPSLGGAPARPEVTAVATSSAEPQTAQGVEPAANSLGYVQQGDGKVVAVVADGESVRLVPQAPPETMAHVTPPAEIPAVASLAQGVTAPGVAPSSPVVATAGLSVRPGGLPDASAIRQASYQVPSAAAQGPAPIGAGISLAGGPAGTMKAASGRAGAISTAKPAEATDRLAKLPVEMKPLGFVVKADGEFAAILSADDDVYVVRQGDRFAGRYRALSVSAEVVEAEEEPPREAPPPSLAAPPAIPDWLSASAQQGPSLFSTEDCSGCKFNALGEVSLNAPDEPPRDVVSPPPRSATGILPVGGHGQDGHGTWGGTRILPVSRHSQAPDGLGQADQATFIFQTLGYVQTQDGETQAVVADGSQVFLVKQGDIFADQYRATSVDPILVLAVRVSPGTPAGDSLFADTDSGGKPASKNLSGYLHLPLSGMADTQIFYEVDASGNPVLASLGLNLFHPPLTGLDF
jgi:Tfp pilus assembly protein PilP